MNGEERLQDTDDWLSLTMRYRKERHYYWEYTKINQLDDFVYLLLAYGECMMNSTLAVTHVNVIEFTEIFW